MLLLAPYKGQESIYENKFNIEHSSDDGVILAAIITRHLNQYFSANDYFVSIVGSAKVKDIHFQDDLFDDPSLAKFPHNVLNELDQTMFGEKNVINLVLVDDYESLK